MKKIFNSGDFVRIKEGTHDERMPTSRMGHLIERNITIQYWGKDKDKRQPKQWKVLMTNGVVLRFHEMFMEHVE
tara:strand:- start:2182 stop:2403 length:222 start_codon:yes stop_codon:yes gene_type:complete